MAKALGFILMIIGVIAIALSFSQVRSIISITLPAQFSDIYLIVAGIVLVLLGSFMLKGSGGGRARAAGQELPIYQGNKIIGYRKV
jgi:ABC-type uncharacterized transport system permease subunit